MGLSEVCLYTQLKLKGRGFLSFSVGRLKMKWHGLYDQYR